MRRASARPALPCRYTPHTAACSGGAPRAASPATMPASVSPEPDVARPTVSALVPIQRSRPASAIQLSAPLSTTTAPNRCAACARDAPRARPRPLPSRRRAVTPSRPRAASAPRVRRAARAASRRHRSARIAGRVEHQRRVVAQPADERREQRVRRALARHARARRASRPPARAWSREQRDRARARDLAAARLRQRDDERFGHRHAERRGARRAPSRAAACPRRREARPSPASSTAPGTCADCRRRPARGRARPCRRRRRAVGSGKRAEQRARRRAIARVRRVSLRAAPARRDATSPAPRPPPAARRSCTRRRREPSARRRAPVERVRRHAAVGDVALAVDREDLVLRQLLDQIAQAEHDHLMRDDEHARRRAGCSAGSSCRARCAAGGSRRTSSRRPAAGSRTCRRARAARPAREIAARSRAASGGRGRRTPSRAAARRRRDGASRCDAAGRVAIERRRLARAQVRRREHAVGALLRRHRREPLGRAPRDCCSPRALSGTSTSRSAMSITASPPRTRRRARRCPRSRRGARSRAGPARLLRRHGRLQVKERTSAGTDHWTPNPLRTACRSFGRRRVGSSPFAVHRADRSHSVITSFVQ